MHKIKEGYSKARLVITDTHLNAGNRTQGGVLFTLADLALAHELSETGHARGKIAIHVGPP